MPGRAARRRDGSAQRLQRPGPGTVGTLRGYTKDEHRAVMQNFNLIVLSATLASLVWSGRANAGLLPQMAVVAGS